MGDLDPRVTRIFLVDNLNKYISAVNLLDSDVFCHSCPILIQDSFAIRYGF